MYHHFKWKWKTEAQAIFLNPFTVCSSCKWMFVIYPCVYKETNRSYLLDVEFPSSLWLENKYATVYMIK